SIGCIVALITGEMQRLVAFLSEVSIDTAQVQGVYARLKIFDEQAGCITAERRWIAIGLFRENIADDELVVAGAADRTVVSVFEVERIVAGAARGIIDTFAADQNVIAIAAVELIAIAPAIYLV